MGFNFSTFRVNKITQLAPLVVTNAALADGAVTGDKMYASALNTNTSEVLGLHDSDFGHAIPGDNWWIIAIGAGAVVGHYFGDWKGDGPENAMSLTIGDTLTGGGNLASIRSHEKLKLTGFDAIQFFIVLNKNAAETVKLRVDFVDDALNVVIANELDIMPWIAAGGQRIIFKLDKTNDDPTNITPGGAAASCLTGYLRFTLEGDDGAGGHTATAYIGYIGYYAKGIMFQTRTS
jgi:hypothetical protein